MRTPEPWAPPKTPTLARDLRALGISNRKLAGEVARGTLVQLRRGVYVDTEAVGEDARELHVLRAWAEQVADPALVPFGHTAALAWGLPFETEDSAAEQLPLMAARKGTTKRARATTSARIVLRDVPAHHVVLGPKGLRLTSLARTAIDVADGELPHVLTTLDAALRAECQAIRGVSRRRDLADPRIQAAGRGALTEALATVRPNDRALADSVSLADPRRETPIESLSAGHIILAGLPEPIPQAPIDTVMGTFYPDFLWPEYRLIGEADGDQKYGTPRDMIREKQREQVLRDLGFAFVRWRGREIRLTPGVVIDRIGRALAAC